MSNALHASSVRIPSDLYRKSSSLAARRKISFNALVQHALQREIEDELEDEMYRAATLIGQDEEGSDVEFAFEAQAEVAVRNG